MAAAVFADQLLSNLWSDRFFQDGFKFLLFFFFFLQRFAKFISDSFMQVSFPAHQIIFLAYKIIFFFYFSDFLTEIFFILLELIPQAPKITAVALIEKVHG